MVIASAWWARIPFNWEEASVFSPGNRDLYAHVSKTFGDNASISELLAALPS
jgi:hypothetical protein